VLGAVAGRLGGGGVADRREKTQDGRLAGRQRQPEVVPRFTGTAAVGGMDREPRPLHAAARHAVAAHVGAARGIRAGEIHPSSRGFPFWEVKDPAVRIGVEPQHAVGEADLALLGRRFGGSG
jgi:hypothetical protein